MTAKLDNFQRTLYPVSQITEGTRVRKDYGDLKDLADSIAENGLIHPIVINTKGVLIAGGRRFRAMTTILKWTEVPVNFFEFLDEAHLRVLEREENVRRQAMHWTEEVESIAIVHNFRQLQSALKSEKWTQRATAEVLGYSEAHISYSLQLADLVRKGDKEIIACSRAMDAIHLLIKRRAEEAIKLSARLTVPKTSLEQAKTILNSELGDTHADIFTTAPGTLSSGGVGGLADDGEMPNMPASAKPHVIPLSKMIFHGDCIEILEQFPPASIDHVITDWPYAIDMDMLNQSNPHGGMKNVDMVRKEHDQYENEALHKVVIPAIYRVLKPGGFFITFMDYMTWQATYDLADKAGFKVQRWPLVWHKTTRCMNQSALYNFTKNHEPAIVCRKEGASLINPQPSSIFSGGNEAEEKLLGHPFAKPFGLWKWIYGAVAMRGQTVLDPFAGRGSSTIAALEFGLSPIAIELNEQHHAGLTVNVAEWYKRTLGNVEFV